jgi:hypothetical protein
MATRSGKQQQQQQCRYHHRHLHPGSSPAGPLARTTRWFTPLLLPLPSPAAGAGDSGCCCQTHLGQEHLNPETLTSKLPSTKPQAANRTPQAPARRHIFNCISIMKTAIANITPRPPLPFLPALRVLATPSLPLKLACFLLCCHGVAVVAAACLFAFCIYIGITPSRQ